MVDDDDYDSNDDDGDQRRLWVSYASKASQVIVNASECVVSVALEIIVPKFNIFALVPDGKAPKRARARLLHPSGRASVRTAI